MSTHYVHCNAGAKAYVAYVSQDPKMTLADVCKSIMLCTHQGQDVHLRQIDIMSRHIDDQDGPRKHLALQVADLYRSFDKMTTFTSKYSTIAMYNQDIVQLTDKKLSFVFLK